MRKSLLVFLIITLMISTMGLSVISAKDNGNNQIEEVAIMFKEKHEGSLVKAFGGEIVEEYTGLPMIYAKMPRQSINGLRRNPNIKYVEILTDKVVVPTSTQIMDWGVAKTKATQGWDIGLKGEGVKIGIIDDLVLEHPDLTNVVFRHNITGVVAGDHGTPIAGIIGAQDNDFGTVGIVPNAEIYSYGVRQNSEGFSTSAIFSAIQMAVSHGVDIINMSFTNASYSQSQKDWMDYAYSNGVLLVASAGNSGTNVPHYPASYESVISVSAIQEDEQLITMQNNSWASNYGQHIEFAGAGRLNWSTRGSSYAYFSGTSSATPHVVGALAQYVQLYKGKLDNKQIRKVAQLSARNIGEKIYYGNGILEAPNNVLNVFNDNFNGGNSVNVINDNGLKLNRVGGSTHHTYTKDTFYIHDPNPVFEQGVGIYRTEIKVELAQAGVMSFDLNALVDCCDNYDSLTISVNNRVIRSFSPINFYQINFTENLNEGINTIEFVHVSDEYSEDSISMWVENMTITNTVVSFHSSGYRVIDITNFNSITNYQSSKILWEANTPVGTNINIETSIDGGVTWQSVVNGESIPNLTVGVDMRDIGIKVRQNLSTSVSDKTPLLKEFVIVVNGETIEEPPIEEPPIEEPPIEEKIITNISLEVVTLENTEVITEISIDNGATWVVITDSTSISSLISQNVTSVLTRYTFSNPSEIVSIEKNEVRNLYVAD